MNAIKRRALNTGGLAAILLFTEVGAHAEQARFNLPFQVHWGPAILEPGEYTLNVPMAQSWPQQIFLTTNGKAVSFLPATESLGSQSERSYLQLVTVRGTYYVREYKSGPTGKQFTFLIPKGAAEAPTVEETLSSHGNSR